jgi:hypothetical protein
MIKGSMLMLGSFDHQIVLRADLVVSVQSLPLDALGPNLTRPGQGRLLIHLVKPKMSDRIPSSAAYSRAQGAQKSPTWEFGVCWSHLECRPHNR